MDRETAGTRAVGAWAAEFPGTARIFDHFGIDFCCGGSQTLAAACAAKNLDLDTLLAALQAPAAAAPDATADWRHEPLAALAQYIVTRHHRYVRAETPQIQRWLDKAVAAHGARHPELARIRHHFTALSAELAQHMAKEELVLFPAIAKGAPHLAQPVRMMVLEHDHAGRDLAEIRSASGDFTPPPDACNTYRALYHALEEFERDLHRHVHLENNILFPRALALEANGAMPRP